MSKINFNANRLITSTFEIEFDYDISKVEYDNGIYLVLLEIPKGSTEVDNLFGVDEKGKICWRVQSIKEAFEIPQNTPYVSLVVASKGVAKVTSFYGLRFTVNTSNGKLIEKESIGW